MITLRDLTDKKGFIATKKAMRADIIPWLSAALFGIVLYYGLVWVLADFGSDWTISGTAAQYDLFGIPPVMLTKFEIVKYSIVLAACILARRSAALSTWLLVILVMLAWPFLGGNTLANLWFPHSPVPELMVIVGLLALGRLFEYLYMRNSPEFTTVTLENSAAVLYSITAFSLIMANSYFVWALFI